MSDILKDYDQKFKQAFDTYKQNINQISIVNDTDIDKLLLKEISGKASQYSDIVFNGENKGSVFYIPTSEYNKIIKDKTKNPHYDIKIKIKTP